MAAVKDAITVGSSVRAGGQCLHVRKQIADFLWLPFEQVFRHDETGEPRCFNSVPR
jgi:hypothetical protein